MSRDQKSLIHINVESDFIGLILLSQKSVPHRRGEVMDMVDAPGNALTFPPCSAARSDGGSLAE